MFVYMFVFILIFKNLRNEVSEMINVCPVYDVFYDVHLGSFHKC